MVAEVAFASTAAAFLAEAMRRVGQREFSMALTGGSSPRGPYRHLSGIPGLPWDRARLFFGDERGVPPDHPESNYGMARLELLSRVPVSDARVHRMEAERDDRDAAAADYGELLPARLDILLLGIGPDGHTCSLFPGATELEERERRVVPSRSPEPPHPRLTITPPVIRAAALRVMLATGAERARAVARALEGAWAPRECPAQLARDAVWILDRPAAEALEGSPA